MRPGRRGVVTPPYGSTTGGAQQRVDVPRAWLPPTKFRAEIWGVSHGHRPLRPAGGRGTARRVVVPYGWLRRVAAIARASGAQRSVCAADERKGRESEQESSPKGSSTPDNPSVGLRPTAPFTQGSLWGRGFGPPGRRPLRKVYRSPSTGPMWASAPTGGCGDRPAIAQAALSEAESAERGAGQIRSLPDTLRVQHGVLCPEVSARPRPCSRWYHLN